VRRSRASSISIRCFARRVCRTEIRARAIAAGRAFDDQLEDFVDVGLPFEPKPRLVRYHLNAEALRTRSPVIDLAETLTAFVKRRLGLDPHGLNIQTVREQLTRLAASDFRIGRSEGEHSVT
jgi:hypothetical protein